MHDKICPPNWFHLVDTHICAIFGQCSVCLLPNLLSVHLGCTAVILGVGVVCGAAMLAEERRLQREGERKLFHHITAIGTNNANYTTGCQWGFTKQERSCF